MSKENNMGSPSGTVAKKSRIPLVVGCVIGAIVVLCIASYLILCAWASHHILQRTSALGVELAGMTEEEAVAAVEEQVTELQNTPVNLVCEQTESTFSCSLAQAGLSLNETALKQAISQDSGGFLTRGWTWLHRRKAASQSASAADLLYFANPSYLTDLMEQAEEELTQPMVPYSYTVEGNSLTITRGTDGLEVSMEDLETQLMAALAAGELTDIPITAEWVPADEPDFDQLYNEVLIEPEDAHLDSDTYEVVDSVVGVSFDVENAETLWNSAGDSQTCTISLVYTDPDLSTEEFESLLFRDVLGESTTYISGSSNRLSNVTLAAQMCNDSILNPGEIFSYADHLGDCSESQGFLPAPSYLDGATVDSVGGGTCQDSSTIYAAVLDANLEVVERRCHTYTISYLPLGSDAMYSTGWSDMKFANDTDYPVKLELSVSGRYLTVQILGTKLDNTYVKMEFNTLSTTPYTTTYKIDDSVTSPGKTKVSVTPYTGYKVEAYRCVYSGDGTLLSRTYESTSTYSKRDQVVLVNSADAAQYGLASAVPADEPDPDADADTGSEEPADIDETQPDTAAQADPDTDATAAEAAAEVTADSEAAA